MRSNKGRAAISSIVSRWGTALQEPLFKQRLLIGMVFFMLLLPSFPVFFQFIQKRQGYFQEDIILTLLPAADVSVPIFLITWAMATLITIRAIQKPATFILFLYGFILLNITRFISICMMPCNPPSGLIPISDPISNLFYGESYVTKDLFYSGHTATQFLIFLCLESRRERYFGLLCTVLMGILVLIQHVHFTIDVVMAPIFTFFCYLIAKRLCNNSVNETIISG